MNNTLSDNAKAILLLTAPLIVGKVGRPEQFLSLTEYNSLVRRIKDAGCEPADLLKPGWEDILSGTDVGRIKQLLERGLLLSQVIERWQSMAIWVISRADAEYPRRLKERLREKSPPVLYGCGNRDILESGGLAVVGSRNASDELTKYAEYVGDLAAISGCTIISGAARGIDQAAMHGALREWGTVAGVLSSDLEKEAVNRSNREMLMEDHLVLVSPYDPKARFNVGNAMQRNKLIYALADVGFVIDSSNNKGGTWNGAVEQLDKLRLVPVYIRSKGAFSAGLQGLQRKGALPWPNPQTPNELREVLDGKQLPPKTDSPKQETLLPNGNAVIEPGQLDTATQIGPSLSFVEPAGTTEMSAADALFAAFEKLIEDVGSQVSESYVADHLKIEKKQATAWLKRLVDEGKYTRQGRPAKYIRNNRIF